MAKCSVNECLFVIDMDDESESFLTQGEMLPDGIIVEEDGDRGEEYTFYVSEDGRFSIVAAAPALAERWVQEHYLPKRALQPHFTDEGDIDCYLLISPSSLCLKRLMDVRVHGSNALAHVIATAIAGSRILDPQVNLRDGIVCELFGVVLPTYTKTPPVADSCLMRNVLRGKYDVEDIRRPEEFSSFEAGLNKMTFNQSMTQFGLAPDTIEPYFQSGEYVDDFLNLKASITGPLCLRPEYQIFSTNTDSVLFVMSEAWADLLVEKGLLFDVDLKSIRFDREMLYVLVLSRRQALEAVNNRHFGCTQKDVFEFALALKRVRNRFPEADMKNAVYVQSLGLVLPLKFEGGCLSEDYALMRDVMENGPFAQSAFLDDVLQAALGILHS